MRIVSYSFYFFLQLINACSGYAVRALLSSLSHLIGAEMELGHAVGLDWAAKVTSAKIDKWSKDALEALSPDLEKEIQDVFQEEYWRLMRKVGSYRLPIVGDEMS